MTMIGSEPNVTNDQISKLRAEAGAAGDGKMVEICDRALDGHFLSRCECARVIAEANARAK